MSERIKNKDVCIRCEGCGRIADSDDGEPITSEWLRTQPQWAENPPAWYWQNIKLTTYGGRWTVWVVGSTTTTVLTNLIQTRDQLRALMTALRPGDWPSRTGQEKQGDRAMSELELQRMAERIAALECQQAESRGFIDTLQREAADTERVANKLANHLSRANDTIGEQAEKLAELERLRVEVERLKAGGVKVTPKQQPPPTPISADEDEEDELQRLRAENIALRTRLKTITIPIPNQEDYARLQSESAAMRAAIAKLPKYPPPPLNSFITIKTDDLSACHAAAEGKT